jgi:aspartyl-tRNA(Asn)/glutamyl-tRNA(Gln) amidotransferase subunit A
MQRIPDWRTLDGSKRRAWRDAARDRARALEPLLNAFAHVTRATEPAARSPSPLGGMPYAAKDMFQTPSHRPGGGFADSGDLGISGTSDLLRRLDAAGADLIGFTNMTELAYEPSGFNASRGRVRNPWNLDFITGGSSSGSAAAVASGSVVAALGSDTGGSLRIPAQGCGVTAWKPTYGLVATHGAMPLAPTLDTVGLIARSADDMLPLVPIVADLPAARPVERAAVLADVVTEAEPAVRRAVANAVAVLSDAGVAIDERAGLAAIDAADGPMLTVLQGESARVHGGVLDQRPLAAALRRRLAKGFAISDAALAEAIAARPRLARDFAETVLAGNDVAVLPVMAIATPRAAECDPGAEQFSARTLYALSRLTRFVNMLGLPAVALPAGFDDNGMPIAVQIVGRTGSDLALIEVARNVQQITDWHARVPTAVADIVDGWFEP